LLFNNVRRKAQLAYLDCKQRIVLYCLAAIHLVDGKRISSPLYQKAAIITPVLKKTNSTQIN